MRCEFQFYLTIANSFFTFLITSNYKFKFSRVTKQIQIHRTIASEEANVYKMPSRRDDNQILVQNEEVQDDILDNRFGGQVVDGDGGEFYDSVILPSDDIQHTVQPNDQFNFTYLVFYLLGAATMAPWNFFITADDVSS